MVAGLPDTGRFPTNLHLYNIDDMPQLSDADLAQVTGGKWLIARWFWKLSHPSPEASHWRWRLGRDHQACASSAVAWLHWKPSILVQFHFKPASLR